MNALKNHLCHNLKNTNNFTEHKNQLNMINI